MIERPENVTELEHRRYLQIAEIFAEAFDQDGGNPLAAGAAVREALGASMSIATLEALQPYVRDELERRGYEFEDVEDAS